MSMKNANDIIASRTLNLSVCKAVLQPTAPLRADFEICNVHKDQKDMSAEKNSFKER
jgi:hypothetical protein